MEIEVWGISAKYLGTANSFGEARRMQQASLPDDLKPLYAGIQDGIPLFYREMITREIAAKYPALSGE